MAIFLRTFGVDDNPAGASVFVDVPVPVGTRDGDLVVLAVSVDSASVDIAPPPGWTKAFRTDPSRAISLAVYWKIAFGEGERWAFALSASAVGQGACAVYGGADGWEPVEIVTAAATLANVNQNTPATATSLDGEELVLFLCADAAHSFTPAAGYLAVAEKQNGGTVALHRQAKASAGPVPAGTVTFGSAANGASAIVVVRPTAATSTVDDVRQRLVDGFPRGVEKVYDLEPGGDYYKLLQAIAMVAKETAFDLLDLLRLEILPQFSRYVLPDWERIFGLTTTRTALLGTIPDRQAQVISRWREAAGLGSTRDALTAILGPLFGYFSATPAQVVTTDRGDLDVAHRYIGPLLTIASSASASFIFTPVDGGKVSSAGPRTTLEYVSGFGTFAATLTAPSGESKTWAITLGAQALDLLWAKELAGAREAGSWTLTIDNTTGGTLSLVPSVVVEGVTNGLNDGQLTAAAMFDWGVYADPAHLGENGKPADFSAARAAIQRAAFAHTIGNLLQSLDPWPEMDAGVHASIPDECVPV